MLNRKRIKHLEYHIESLTKTVNELSHQSSSTTIAKLVANEYAKHKRLEPFRQLKPMSDVWVDEGFIFYKYDVLPMPKGTHRKFAFISLNENNETVTVCNEALGVCKFSINYVSLSNPKGGDAN